MSSCIQSNPSITNPLLLALTVSDAQLAVAPAAVERSTELIDINRARREQKDPLANASLLTL
jgi:hypothetical protein